jgi:hypothetical protein
MWCFSLFIHYAFCTFVVLSLALLHCHIIPICFSILQGVSVKMLGFWGPGMKQEIALVNLVPRSVAIHTK